jgi:hypothetical protein
VHATSCAFLKTHDCRPRSGQCMPVVSRGTSVCRKILYHCRYTDFVVISQNKYNFLQHPNTLALLTSRSPSQSLVRKASYCMHSLPLNWVCKLPCSGESGKTTFLKFPSLPRMRQSVTVITIFISVGRSLSPC